MDPSYCVCDLRVQATGAETQLSDAAWKPGHTKAEGKASPALRRPDYAFNALWAGVGLVCLSAHVCAHVCVCVCRGRDGGGL